MKVVTTSISGFCFGVKRAVKLAEKAAKHAPKGQEKGEVYSLGPLIHNRSVIQELSKKGVRILNDIRGIHRGQTLIIRSHGVHPHILFNARKKGIKIIDATCPFVNRCQRLARSLMREGYRVIIFGDKNHSEVKSIKGFTDDRARVVSAPKELPAAVKGVKKVGLLSQTTQSKFLFKEIVATLVDLVPEVKIFNTICQTAARRQEEAKRLSNEVCLAIVVGGRDSANTAQLVSIFRKSKVKTYHVEDLNQLKAHRLNGNGHKAIAVMAGASTPRKITREIIQYLEIK